MLPLIGIAAAVVFLIVWRIGLLDDLRRWSLARRAGPSKPKRDLLPNQVDDPEMSKRLEVFEEFIDELPGEED